MPAKFYPFIDIAVHERVREHFTRGDATALFSPDMGSILWSNGAGAALFGFASVYDFLDLGAERGDVAFRQLSATARQLSRSGDRRTFVMRLASGFRSIPVNASVEMITVRPGETAVLFSAPSIGATSLAERAARMISGLDDPDTHMAVLDADGAVLAASEGFTGLLMAPQTCQTLVSAAARAPDWLIKRPVATGKGYLPAAIGKLSDDPPLHLVFAVETILGNLDPDERFAAENTEAPAEAPGIPSVAESIEDIDEAPDLFDADDLIPASAGSTDAAPASPAESSAEEPETPLEAAFTAEGFDAAEPHASADAPMEDGPAPEEDESTARIEANPATDEDGIGQAETEADDAHSAGGQHMASRADDPTAAPSSESFRFDPRGRAVRFVWKIDANGRFSEISDEFASAVGPRAADVVGRSFADLAAHYGLDPDNTVIDLLKRRDTWSGKTIYWPVENEALIVPVDLAALPTYSRNREFDGFRGFGIVRIGDAIESGRGALQDFAPLPEKGDDTPAEHDAALSASFAETPLSAAEPQPGPADADLFAELDLSRKDGPESVDDPFQGEQPALWLAESSGRRASDKIVVLDSHRKTAGETLSRSEQAAFREIARQLGESVEKQAPTTDGANQTAGPFDPFSGLEKPAHTKLEGDAFADMGGDAEASIPSPEEEPSIDDAGENIPAAPIAAIPSRTSEDAGLTPEIVDGLPVALLIHSGDLLYHANPEFLALTGYQSLDGLNEEGGIDALFAGDDDDLADLPAGTMVLLRKDGRMLNVTARLQSVRWREKNALMLAVAPLTTLPAAPTALAGLLSEEAPQPETGDTAALRMQIEELQSILETATDGVVIIGADSEIRSLNRSASALFNYDDEEIRGKPFASLFAHESQKAILDYLSGLSGHGVASVLNDGREVIGREASGGFIPLFMTMGRLASSNGYCAVIRDITQWKRTEEELRNAKRAAETANAHKTDSLARISHEIRTPLNAIIGFSDMMASEHFGPIGNPRYVEYASDIGRSGRHVLDIVNDLLDISKIEAGEMELEFTAVEINDAVSEAVSLVQPQANSQRVIIRTSLSTAVPSVVADSRSIKQMALNILSNAIRFTPAGGQIVVSTAYEANGSVVLRIRDTGIGMTRAELEQAMKPFRQVTTGTRKRGDGTGLGLPLTKAMAEANRAQFSISSMPNEGTLVEVSFPPQRVLAN